MRVTGAVALITGASSGIGAATAAALSSAGATVLLAGRDPARLADVARRTGGTALVADLTSPDGPARLAAGALRAAAGEPGGSNAGLGSAGTFSNSLDAGPAGSSDAGPGGSSDAGGIDILVNNAGVGWSGALGEMPAGKVAELVTVNLTATMELSRLLVPGMIQRGRGRVVFVSSIAGVTGVRGEAVYAATKAGLIAFAESLAYELAEHGIGVSVINPGVIDTPFFERRGRPYGRTRPAPVPAERAAQAIVAALTHDRAVTYVPGWLRVPAWLHGAAPSTFRALATRFGDPG
jgi:short-subunit dehydrogenase